MTSDNHVTGPVTEAMERVLRVEAEYWASFRENRAPVIGPRDLRAVLDAAIVTMKSKEQASVHSPDEVERLTPEEAWQDLVEKDDRTSPEEYPEMCLITRAELTDYMNRAALQHPAKEMGE